MEVHCDEGVAIHIGPEPCAGVREDAGEASAGERIGQPSSREECFPEGRRCQLSGSQHEGVRYVSAQTSRRGRRPWHVQKLLVRELGSLLVGQMPIEAAWSAAGRRGAVAADERSGEV